MKLRKAIRITTTTGSEKILLNSDISHIAKAWHAAINAKLDLIVKVERIFILG